MKHALATSLLTALLPFFCFATAEAQEVHFSYTQIASSEELLPDGRDPYFFDAPVVSGSNLAFYTYDTNVDKGLYTYINGTTELAIEQGFASPIGGTFTNQIGIADMNGSTLLFGGDVLVPQGDYNIIVNGGIYTYSEGAVELALDRQNFYAPGSSSPFNRIGIASFDDEGITFSGQAAGLKTGVYRLKNSQISTIINNDFDEAIRVIHGALGTADDMTLQISMNGIVGYGLYYFNGTTLTPIMNTDMQVPGTTATFDSLYFFSHRDGLTTWTGRYREDGFLYNGLWAKDASSGIFETVARAGELSPDGVTPFQSFDLLAATDGDNVVFNASLSDGSGGTYIYNPEFGLFELIDYSEGIDGKSISQVRVASNGYKDGHLGFAVSFTDGTQGLYSAHASVIPLPPAFLLMISGLLALTIQGRRKRAY